MKWRALFTSVGIMLMAASGALAAGLPVAPVQGGRGIGIPGSPVRFVASPTGRDTVLERVTTNPWHVQAKARVSGRYGIPGAAYDGTLTGLSADGRTLVLEQLPQNHWVRTTRLLVLATGHMRIERRIVMPGWSVVDAISPHGRWMYLLHYSSSNITQYEVLAYDLVRGRLLAKPIVDPRDWGKAMAGLPLARVMSPGGVWAYTLYMRPSGVPFVHALDTAGLRAVCIDLPSLNGLGFNTARLVLGPGAKTLQVRDEGFPTVTINTRTFAVGTGNADAWSASVEPASHDPRVPGGGDLPWELVLLPIAGVAGVGIALRRRSKLRRPSDRAPAI